MHLVQLALHNASHLSTRSGQQQIAFARAASCDSVQNSVSPQNDVEQQQPDPECSVYRNSDRACQPFDRTNILANCFT